MAQEDNPADAIIGHHAEMVRELQARADSVIATVARGDASQSAAAAAADYFETTIVPHALAEETTLYAAAADTEHRLVESLKMEHVALRRLGAALRDARDGATRAAIVGALSQLFAMHATKENEYVLPTILAQPRTDLRELLRRMHAESGLHAQSGSPLNHEAPMEATLEPSGRVSVAR
jgi:hypothetical protein